MVRLVAGGLEDRSKDPDLKAGVRPVDPPEDRELTGVTAAADDDDDSILKLAEGAITDFHHQTRRLSSSGLSSSFI